MTDDERLQRLIAEKMAARSDELLYTAMVGEPLSSQSAQPDAAMLDLDTLDRIMMPLQWQAAEGRHQWRKLRLAAEEERISDTLGWHYVENAWKRAGFQEPPTEADLETATSAARCERMMLDAGADPETARRIIRCSPACST